MKKTLLLLVYMFFTLAPSAPVYGAQIILVTATSSTLQAEFEMSVLLDTEGEVVNGVVGEIHFPKDIVASIGVTQSDSLGVLWVSSIEPTNGVITIAGLIPDGFGGVISPGNNTRAPGKLATFRMRALRDGTATFDPRDFEVTLHDGAGTPLPVRANTLVVPVRVSGATSTPVTDIYIPLPFTPEVVTEGSVFYPNPMLVFHTTDKDSGISHYEIKIGERDFERAESPYPLDEKLLRNTIVIRAIDNAGNKRDVVLRTTESPSLPLHEAALGLIILVLLLATYSWVKKLKHYSSQ